MESPYTLDGYFSQLTSPRVPVELGERVGGAATAAHDPATLHAAACFSFSAAGTVCTDISERVLSLRCINLRRAILAAITCPYGGSSRIEVNIACLTGVTGICLERISACLSAN
jgi:hypothetical protein